MDLEHFVLGFLWYDAIRRPLYTRMQRDRLIVMCIWKSWTKRRGCAILLRILNIEKLETMSLYQSKLRNTGPKGAPIIDSLSVDRTMKTRMQNHGQSNLLREKTLTFEKELDQSRRTSLREEHELRKTILELRKPQNDSKEWLLKNHGRFNDWKQRERTKLEHKYSSRSSKEKVEN